MCYTIRFLEDEHKVGSMYMHELWDGEFLLMKAPIRIVTATLNGLYAVKPQEVYEIRTRNGIEEESRVQRVSMLYRIAHMNDEEVIAAEKAANLGSGEFRQLMSQFRDKLARMGET